MNYQETDTLSLATSVPISGPGGTSTPETPAGNSDYSTWSWEAILATVLNIPISDRSEVTGQPWLTVVQAGQPVPGGHQIWSANWDTKPKSGATSLQVYLSPALYAGGGAWDRFANAPGQVLSGPANSLSVIPSTFHGVQVALASVMNAFYDMSSNLDSMHNDVSNESTPFQGNVATVVGELFDRLHGVTLSLYDQMSNPSYSDAVGAAGAAATAFLGAINSAYTAWNQLDEHSPLGAVVQVLMSIATPDGNGGYTIPDPENTPFGDLTTPGAWASVEQQAKGTWMSLLTGGSNGFEGLDLLGRTALTQLVGQYATTTRTVAPVVGPAPPAVVQTPADGQPDPNGGPQGPNPKPVLANGNGGPGPVGVGNTDFVTGGGGGLPSDVTVPPGQGNGTLTPNLGTGSNPPGFTGGPAPGTELFAGPAGGPGGFAGPIGFPGGPGSSFLATPPGTDHNAGPGAFDPEVEAANLNIPGTTGILSGAIGATRAPAGPPGEKRERRGGFTGTVGRRPGSEDPALHRPAHGPALDLTTRTGAASRKAGMLTAPAAGFSVGGGPHGSVLSRSAVPVVSDKPPGVTSSQINMQLTPAGGEGGTGPALPGSPAGPLGGQLTGPVGGPAGGPAGGPLGGSPFGGSTLIGEPGPSLIGGSGGVLGGQGTQPGGVGPMMMPQSGAGGPGTRSQERVRRAYLPEDDDYWGTETDQSGYAVGAPDLEVDDEPDFDVPGVFVGIGAEAAPSTSTETMSNWRT